MSDVTLQPGNYWFQYSIETSKSVPSNASGWRTELQHGQPSYVSYIDVHSETLDGFVSNHAVIAFTCRINNPTAMSAMDRLVSSAYQRGVDRGISVNAFVAQLQSNSSSLSLNPLAPYRTINRDFHATSGNASAEIVQSTTQKLFTSSVADSSVPGEIGQPTPAATQAVTDALARAVSGLQNTLDIGIGWKVAAVAVVGVIGFAMIGYGIRSVK